MSNGSSIANVNVQSLTSSLTLPISSTVKCAKSQWGYSHSLVGFGAFNPTFLDAGVVHQAPTPMPATPPGPASNGSPKPPPPTSIRCR